MSTPPRQLHLNAFLMGVGHHEAAWRAPESSLTATWELKHYVELAQLAERGTFDSIFFADGPALQGDLRYRPVAWLDPLILLPAIAAATQRIGLVATASTTYNEPYNLARYLDIESDDVEAEARRLEQLGAKIVERVRTWLVLEAPTGQRFCVIRAKRSLEGAPGAQLWP